MKKLELNLYVDLTELNPTVDLGMTNHDIYMSHDQKEGVEDYFDIIMNEARDIIEPIANKRGWDDCGAFGTFGEDCQQLFRVNGPLHHRTIKSISDKLQKVADRFGIAFSVDVQR